MKQKEAEKAVLVSIDTVYIPVSDKRKATDWFVEHFGLVRDGDHLRAGNQEVFLLETSEKQSSNFMTKDWIKGEEYYEMPALCFRTTDIAKLYSYAKQQEIALDEFRDERWFWEFDFYDLDGNKFKVWQPKE